jgi:hypothetical protein
LNGFSKSQVHSSFCALLGRTPQPTPAPEAIARNIVEAAKQGERDADLLRDAGLAATQEYVAKGN